MKIDSNKTLFKKKSQWFDVPIDSLAKTSSKTVRLSEDNTIKKKINSPLIIAQIFVSKKKIFLAIPR